jgi:excisionase family DNA binding protein
MILQCIDTKILEAYAKAHQAMVEEVIRDALEQAQKSLTKPPNDRNDTYGPNLSVKQAADFSSVAASTIRLMIRKGRLPVQRFGRRVIIKREDMERLMQRSPASPLH